MTEELKKHSQTKYIHWCDDCPKAYDDTCSGADAVKCEAEKSQFLRVALNLNLDNLDTEKFYEEAMKSSGSWNEPPKE